MSCHARESRVHFQFGDIRFRYVVIRRAMVEFFHTFAIVVAKNAEMCHSMPQVLHAYLCQRSKFYSC